MRWTTDISAGDWLRDRVDGDWSIHHFVPRGYEAYARIFHPVEVRSIPGRAMPTHDEMARMPDHERHDLVERMSAEEATWAEAAAAFGTTMHALAQWDNLLQVEHDQGERIAADGREFSGGAFGALSPRQLARVAGHLAAHTTTASDAYAGLWSGWGGLVGFMGQAPSRAFLQFGEPDSPELARHNEMLGRSFTDRFNNVFRRSTWQEGILSREISEGPRLQLPDREYILFRADVRTFEDPSWILDAPWRDRPAEEHGFEPSAQAPGLMWPADQAWVLASEIDYDSTIIAGSAGLIEAICADAALEALPIPEGADLSWDGDTVNR
ncbi:hypothetical protein [Microbacterium sp.]|uniref:hypothetical protein n=1 Tax=Microbacterium sp. TaxID=51671 RepID=UPI00261FA6F3|nr:hypothetical protein [Microbacterium sp.]